MMFVSGEFGEPSVETTGIIEEIVRQQVIEIVSTWRIMGLDTNISADNRSSSPNATRLQSDVVRVALELWICSF